MVKQSAAKSYILLVMAVLIILIGVSFLPNPSAELEVAEEEELEEEPLELAGMAAGTGVSLFEKELSLSSGLTLSYLSSSELEKKDESITTLVIVIHGIARKAEVSFNALAPVVVKKGEVLIAPYFPTEEDSPVEKRLFWTTEGWKRGDQSTEKYHFRYSSFEVMDALITNVMRKLPKVNRIIVVGHSAGGQFVHRYAAGNQKESSLRGVKMKYIVANPSSYLYLNNQRWDEKSRSFKVPDIKSCPPYDDYAKGLQNLNAYMRSTGRLKIEKNLVNREIFYLLGEADTGKEYLDNTCAAMLQGKNRFERGNIFVEHLKQFYPKNKVFQVVVPDVGHDSARMFRSAEGRIVLS